MERPRVGGSSRWAGTDGLSEDPQSFNVPDRSGSVVQGFVRYKLDMRPGRELTVMCQALPPSFMPCANYIGPLDPHPPLAPSYEGPTEHLPATGAF